MYELQINQQEKFSGYDEIFCMAQKRLESLDCVLAQEERGSLTHLICRVRDDILADCGLDELPERLYPVAAERAAGFFLGSITESNSNGIVKQIQEGDTSITYEIKQDAEKERLINTMINSGRHIIADCRALRW